MISRLKREVERYLSWTRSVASWGDIPAALLLSFRRIHSISSDDVVRRLLRRLSRPVWINPKLLHGYKLAIDPNNSDELVIYEEIFLENVYNLSTVPFEPDLIVDCGGFAGHFSLLAKARFPSAQIACFEPHPDNFKMMCSNLKSNGVSVEAHCAAVSSFDGNSFLSGGGCEGRIGEAHDGSRIVKVIDLLSFLARLSPKALLLKMDIEGEERELLPLLIPRLPATCALFFEWHHKESGFTGIEAILNKQGFLVRRNRVRQAPASCVCLDAFALRT